MNKNDFKLGQEVYLSFFESSEKRYNGNYPVIAVGNKWITLSNDRRFDYKTMRVDGGKYSCPAVVYMSEKDYEDERALHHAYVKLQKETRFRPIPNKGVTIQDLEKVFELLKISKDANS